MRAACAPLLALLLVAGCRISFSPLQNRLQLGEESYLVFAARGEGGRSDLYAVRGEGGEIWPVTYTRVDERLPALDGTGRRLAFVRTSGEGHDRVVVLDLPSGAERVWHDVADSGRVVSGLGWAGDTLRARVGGETLHAVPGSDAMTPAPHDTAGFALGLGRPVFATVEPCPAGGLCVRPLGSDTVAVLDADGRDAVPWGADSVGYYVGEEFLVRPLGAGRARTLRWHPEPVGAGEGAAFVPSDR